jgi:hypothetical protein
MEKSAHLRDFLALSEPLNLLLLPDTSVFR